MGFLNEQSLRMIVEAPRNMYDIKSFSFPEISYLGMSMPVNHGQSGPLKKIVIAARFDIHVPVGWPELQIIRGASNGTSNIALTTNTMEPKPTGYLNLYEYNLTAINFNTQIGDTLNISWYGSTLQPNQMRFSLAYYNNRTFPVIPIVSIVVGDCDPETDLLTLNSLYCEEVTVTVTESVTTTKNVTSNQNTLSSTNDEMTIISGVVIISLFFIVLLILLFVFIFVVKRRRKSASMNAIDPIEIMDSNPTDTTREEVKHDETVDCIEMDANQAYITHSETKGEQGAGIENQAYATDTLPTDPNLAYGIVDCTDSEVDASPAYGINTDPNVAYSTNTVPTDPNVAYGTHRDPPQINDYDYVALP
jgi:hypothetical protein